MKTAIYSIVIVWSLLFCLALTLEAPKHPEHVVAALEGK